MFVYTIQRVCKYDNYITIFCIIHKKMYYIYFTCYYLPIFLLVVIKWSCCNWHNWKKQACIKGKNINNVYYKRHDDSLVHLLRLMMYWYVNFFLFIICNCQVILKMNEHSFDELHIYPYWIVFLEIKKLILNLVWFCKKDLNSFGEYCEEIISF